MKKIYGYHLSILCVSMSLHAADDHNDNNTTLNTTTSSLAPSRISNYDQLRTSAHNAHNSNVSKQSNKAQQNIDPEITAEILHAVTYNLDPNKKSLTHKKLKQNIEDLENNNPHAYSALVQGIFALTQKIDNNPTADNIKQYREKKRSNPNTPHTPSSTSESPQEKTITRSVLRKQKTMEQEMHNQEKTLSEIKEEMRKLAWQAAEDAQHEEQDIAKRNMILGFLGTVGASIVTAIATYYGAVNAAKITSGSSPAPAPACFCPNGTL